MGDEDFLAQRFEEHRPHLTAVAYRMLGSRAEAEDAVQEAWVRLARSDSDAVANLGGWLTTVVARVCLNALSSRRSRREDPLGEQAAELTETRERGPEQEAVEYDSVGLALLVVLDTLTPAERLAFVLHDLFAVPFDEIAPIVDRTPAAARQLASRARRRVQGAPAPEAEQGRKREIIDAFLAASRGGDFGALLTVLDPDVVLRADRRAVQMGAQPETFGADQVAKTFLGGAKLARVAVIDGTVGAVVAPRRRTRLALYFTVVGDRIAAIEVVADNSHLDALDVRFIG
ncbi:sigma-70 family RNA polymerase sigma factor [Amycolatopsis sp. 195334CR]|uniref:sigma-70 family RNA polymerase sigma factor n=1 Tax=Amycolatopsis sp. 195334CR TaxID=2814588 RepID=UPI001A8E8CB9|nr:sigma-70 family RNA polymerase sigma factor [Amycolatopsis sp. 195334CR]MBN6041981.1 sigma-70 family RNA polymerase sigma factor [Amycolatopsis sp. 195334CR]